jgi:hypothetical protein
LGTWEVTGAPLGTPIPLSFNFDLSGNIDVSSRFPDRNSIATGSFNYFLRSATDSGTSNAGGTATMQSQAGLPTINFVTGNFGSSGVMAQIQPHVIVEQETIPLTDVELEELGLDELKEDIPLDTFNAPLLAGAIASAVSSFGLPDLDILPGTEVEVELDVSYQLNSSISLSTIFTGGIGALNGTMSCGVSSSNGAKAVCDYGSSLALTSITVPFDFTAVDIDPLRVVFDSGLSMDILRESPSVGGVVPEPATGLLMGSGLLVLSYWRRRRFAFRQR